MSKQRTFGVIIGMSGYGKSFFIKNYLIPKLAEKKPVIVLDPMGEYTGKVFEDFPEFMESIRETGGIEAGTNVIRWKEQSTAINLINFVRHIEKPVSFIVEEAHMIFNNSELRKKAKKSLNEICFLGRHYEIDSILCTQRAASLTPNVRSQADFMVSFKQKERADLEYLRQFESAPSDIGQTVATLDVKQFLSIGTQPKGLKEIKINKVNQLKL